MATPGQNAFDSLRGWVTQNSPPQPNGISQFADDILRNPVKPMPSPPEAVAGYTPPKVDPVTGKYTGGSTQGVQNEVQAGQRPVVEGPAGAVDRAGGLRSTAVPAEAAGVKPSTWGRIKGAVGNGVKSVATGSFLDADVGAVAGKLLRGSQGLVNGVGRIAAPIAVGNLVTKAFDTPTEEYARRGNMTSGDSLLGDIGVRAAGVAGDAGNMVTMGGLRYLHDKTFGEGHWDGTQPQSTASSAAAQPRLRGTGDGVRGARFDDPRRMDLDPSRASLGPSRDFSNELNKVPANLPSDLRSGVVVKTVDPKTGRVTYSGRNVAPGADGNTQFVDGMGRNISTRGSVQSIPGRDLRDGVDPYQPAGPQVSVMPDTGGYGLLDKGYQARREMAMSTMGSGGKQTGESRADYATRMQALASARSDITQNRGQDLNYGATLRGQDLNYGATTRGQDMTYGSTIRGQDMDLRGRIEPKMMEMEMAARMRGLNAQIFKQAGGDPRLAAQIAAANGMDPKTFTEMAQAGQTMDHNAATNADKRFEHLAVGVDKDGKGYVDPAKMAIVRNVRDKVAPGFSTMSEQDQAASMPTIAAGTRLVTGINSRRNNGFLQSIGWDDPTPEYTTLPSNDALRKAKVGRVGFFEGALKGGDVSKGDTRIELPDGTVHYAPSAEVGQDELELLKKSGAKLGK